MGVLSGIALNYATSAVYDIVKSTLPRIPANLRREIDSSFEHALKLWSRNAKIRKNEKRELRAILEEYYLNKEEVIIEELPETVQKFFVHFEEALCSNDVAHRFFTNVKDEKSLQTMLQEFNVLKDITQDTNDKVSEIGKSIIYLSHEKSSKGKLSKYLSLNVPSRKKKDIIGRGDELKRLQKVLFEDENALLVNGMGGIGKTTVAQTYVGTYSEEYAHIVWVEFGENEDFKSSLVNTPGLMEELIIPKEGTIDQMFNSILIKLRKIVSKKPCLLVLDNAQDMFGFMNMLPKHPNWHILATSRAELRLFTPIKLGFLSKKDALVLFTKYYLGKELNKKEIKRLLKKVEYHTLTIEVLAKMAGDRNYDFEVLSNALGEDLKAEIETHHSKEEVIERITSYLCSIFDLSDLNEIEIRTLKQLVVMPVGFINLESIATLWYEKGTQDYYDFQGAITKLVKKAWVNMVFSEEGKKIQLHQVVREVLTRTEKFTLNDFVFYIENVLDLFAIDDSVRGETIHDKSKALLSGTPIFSIGMSLMTQLDLLLSDAELLQSSTLIELRSRLGLINKIRGEYVIAQEQLRKVVVWDRFNFGDDHPKTIAAFTNLSIVMKDLGHLNDAREMSEMVVTLNEKVHGHFHQLTSVSYSHLALVYLELHEYKKAKHFLEKAITIDEQSFGTEDPKTANHYSNMVIVLNRLGKYEEAKILIEKTIKILEKTFGEGHPNVVGNYSSLAEVYLKLEDYESSKELFEKALEMNKKNLGDDHDITMKSYSNLGAVYNAAGDFEKAKALMEKTNVLMKKKFGDNHPSTGHSYANLAKVLLSLEDYEASSNYYEKALLILQETFDPSDEYIVRIQRNLNSINKNH